MGDMAGTVVAPIILLLGLLIHFVVCDYDLDYYPPAEQHYELEFLSNVDHVDHVDSSPHIDHDLDHVPDHDHELDHDPEPTHDHEAALLPQLDEPHPEQVRDKWERRQGGTVEGGYTVLEPDGTVHHVRYTENKAGADRRADQVPPTGLNNQPGNQRR